MTRRRTSYRTRSTSYYTNTCGDDTLKALIEDLRMADTKIAETFSDIITAESIVANLQKEENDVYSNRGDLREKARLAAEEKIRSMFVMKGFYLRRVSINDRYIELATEAYSSRNVIRLDFSTNDWRENRPYIQNIRADFEDMNITRAINVSGMIQYAAVNFRDIIDIVIDLFNSYEEIAKEVPHESKYTEIRQLNATINAKKELLATQIRYVAFTKLANERFKWFEDKIEDDAKPYMRYALIKNAKYRTDKRIDDFDQFKFGKTKVMVTNSKNADFLEIRSKNLDDFIPCIWAGRYEIAFTNEDINRAVNHILAK